jgi:hypothetical protein
MSITEPSINNLLRADNFLSYVADNALDISESPEDLVLVWLYDPEN